MKLKKMLVGICALSLLFSTNTLTFAESTMSEYVDKSELVSEKFTPSIPDYISFEEYLEKYGEENVVKGFNKAEAENELKNSDTITHSDTISDTQSNISTPNTTPNDLFLSLIDGQFLGLDVLGVSDLSPDSPDFSIKLRDNRERSYTKPHLENVFAGVPEIGVLNHNPSAGANTVVSPNTNYTYYYNTLQPDQDALNRSAETNSGTYFYKYSFWNQGNYACSTEVTFNGTQLRNYNQQLCMYVYLAAMGGTTDSNGNLIYGSIDCGLMANPSDSDRNGGLYPFYAVAGDELIAYANPIVGISGDSTNPMTLLDRTMVMKLTVYTNSIEFNVYRKNYSVNSGHTYYIPVTGLVRNNSNYTLTFMQAMTALQKDNYYTTTNNKGYFTNVTFDNSKLYRNSGTVPFATEGTYTYYTYLRKPTQMDFDYEDDSETISIDYRKTS